MAEDAVSQAGALAGVIGFPIHHSRSPLIHGFWLADHGLEGRYDRHEVGEEELGTFVSGLRQAPWVGCNVTLPHKSAVVPLLDQVDETARAIGAVNTIWREDDRLIGSNTDAYGFLANLDGNKPGWDRPDHAEKTALVLGAGGAARAILYGLLQRGFERIMVANRTLARAEALCEEFGDLCHAIPLDGATGAAADAALIVNTTAVGMEDGRSPLDLSRCAPETCVTDIVYTPLMTPLLADARSRGLPVVDGLGMLLHQAVPGFERWFGVRPRVTEALRARIIADLEQGA